MNTLIFAVLPMMLTVLGFLIHHRGSERWRVLTALGLAVAGMLLVQWWEPHWPANGLVRNVLVIGVGALPVILFVRIVLLLIERRIEPGPLCRADQGAEPGE
jgi:drug/metabolite transporter (DMT)-like permease